MLRQTWKAVRGQTFGHQLFPTYARLTFLAPSSSVIVVPVDDVRSTIAPAAEVR